MLNNDKYLHDHTGTLHVYKEMLNKQRVKLEVHSINSFFLLFENDPFLSIDCSIRDSWGSVSSAWRP